MADRAERERTQRIENRRMKAALSVIHDAVENMIKGEQSTYMGDHR